MTVIPCADLALYMGSMNLQSAGHANVNMSESPSGAAEMVSLWQTGSSGLLIERTWHIGGNPNVVIVEGT